MARPGPWQRFVDSAVRPGVQPLPPGAQAVPTRSPKVHSAGVRGFVPKSAASLRALLVDRLFPGRAASATIAGKSSASEAEDRPRRRTDLRLVPPVLLVWAAAVAGVRLPVPALIAVFAGLLLSAGGLLLVTRRRRMLSRQSLTIGTPPAPRSFLTTLSIAVILAAAAASHSAVAASQKHDGAVADAVAARSGVVVEAEVAGVPRQLKVPGRSGSDRWAVPATASAIIANGSLIRADAELLIMGGGDWEHVVPGQRIRTTGKLRAAEDGQTQAGILSASTGPATTVAPSAWQEGPGALRSKFAAAAEWIDGDARGLLPGMVTGDTSFLDDQLESAMKTVGMTHLTAVSGLTARAPWHQSCYRRWVLKIPGNTRVLAYLWTSLWTATTHLISNIGAVFSIRRGREGMSPEASLLHVIEDLARVFLVSVSRPPCRGWLVLSEL
jgi:competence protein ComEC